ncbi:hypothetical protein IT575_06510 [bacterium]|nr:hypothetical protein [bacterium]
MQRYFLIGIAACVMSLAASCGGAGAPAPQTPGDTEGPAITVNGVEDGDVVFGNIQVLAAAADPSGIIDFDFEVNGENVATETDGTMAFMWHTDGNGFDTLRFSARDSEGNLSVLELEVERRNFAIIPIPDLPYVDPPFQFQPIPWPGDPLFWL